MNIYQCHRSYDIKTKTDCDSNQKVPTKNSGVYFSSHSFSLAPIGLLSS